jgi:hypothetical protein
MKDETNDEVVLNVSRGIRSEQIILQDMQTGANQIDGHEEYVVRVLMKGESNEKVPAELRTRCWFRFWARGITEEMRILRGDIDLVFFHCLLVEPQETSLIHV